MAPYIRKTARQSWDENRMREAIDAVQSGKMGWLLSSKTYGVPFTTLRRRAQTGNVSKGYLGGHKTTFDANLEKELVKHLQDLEIRFFGMTSVDVRKLAYQIAVKKKIPHRFSNENEMAGKSWLRAFRIRNPTISLRIPEATSAARARGFNKTQVQTFFGHLTEIMEKYKFEPQQIWNVDESGFSTVPSQNAKIFATKGRKQVGILTSAERGHHYTIVCCVNALGTYIPPAFIFPRKNMKLDLMDQAPAGSVGFAQEKGWMNGEVFLKWLQHFVKHSRASPENKVLLLLDGHSSHKNLDVLTFAKRNGIIIFCFPPHCTHRLQPLDVSFFGPLNTFYNQELNVWLKSHPGRTVTHQQVSGIFKEAYLRAATVKNGQSGFASAGIFPLNDNIFPDWMFAPADVTEIELPEALPEVDVNAEAMQQTVTDTSSPPQTSVEVLMSKTQTLKGTKKPNGHPVTFQKKSCPLLSKDEQPGPSSSIDEQPGPTSEDVTHNLSISEISPLPKAIFTKRSNRKKGKFGVLNSTPDMDELKLEVASKKATILKRSAVRSAKRKIRIPSSSESENEEPEFSGSEEEEDPACIYCLEPYSRSRCKEWWLRCQVCQKWCHAECIGLPRSAKIIICDICK